MRLRAWIAFALLPLCAAVWPLAPARAGGVDFRRERPVLEGGDPAVRAREEERRFYTYYLERVLGRLRRLNPSGAPSGVVRAPGTREESYRNPAAARAGAVLGSVHSPPSCRVGCGDTGWRTISGPVSPRPARGSARPRVLLLLSPRDAAAASHLYRRLVDFRRRHRDWRAEAYVLCRSPMQAIRFLRGEGRSLLAAYGRGGLPVPIQVVTHLEEARGIDPRRLPAVVFLEHGRREVIFGVTDLEREWRRRFGGKGE